MTFIYLQINGIRVCVMEFYDVSTGKESPTFVRVVSSNGTGIARRRMGVLEIFAVKPFVPPRRRK